MLAASLCVKTRLRLRYAVQQRGGKTSSSRPVFPKKRTA
ncbi:hypothetical protein PANA5342_0343 [Pantoea ananatis LMG 5342]|nr:hypothetical protein PANA5342_0343 [Pantoea ananatis LMG 5342]